MRRWIKTGLMVMAGCAVALPALAYLQYSDGLGNLFNGMVQMYWTGSAAQYVSPTTPLPVKPGGPYATAPSADQLLTLSRTPQSLTVPSGYNVAVVTVTGGPADYRSDGGSPAGAVFLTLPPGVWTLSGPLAGYQFVSDASVSGTVMLGVEYAR